MSKTPSCQANNLLRSAFENEKFNLFGILKCQLATVGVRATVPCSQSIALSLSDRDLASSRLRLRRVLEVFELFESTIKLV